ncbi:hypothetical protein AAEU32_15245 [Pseudoalteromonas sp. SSDWG2]|uniref:hypothetical protein n=1 Tax=Pseudoalteromonas sp. SSDWG2 TaxID=3139391 RepID=UPI003BA9D427
MHRFIWTLISLLFLTACSYTAAPLGQTEKLYDFDQQVHYYQTQLSAKRYRLEIVEDGYQHFAKQSMFLLRHAQRLCGGSVFSIRVLKGVQEYDRFPTTPRAYEPNLLTEISCE